LRRPQLLTKEVQRLEEEEEEEEEEESVIFCKDSSSLMTIKPCNIVILAYISNSVITFLSSIHPNTLDK
jgi:hypothetical protein